MTIRRARGRPSLLVPAFVVLFALAPRTARAESDDERRWPERTAVEGTFGVIVFTPRLAAMKFDGRGTPPGAKDPVDFSHRGRELGVDAPSMWAGELALHVRLRWASVGILGFFGGHPGVGDATPDPPGNAAAQAANTGSMLTYGGALDFAAVVPTGSVLSIRVGPLVGVRGFTMPLSGWETKSSDGSISTGNATSDAQVFVQPRVRLLVRPRGADGFFLGASLGADVVGGGVAAGLCIGLTSTE